MPLTVTETTIQSHQGDGPILKLSRVTMSQGYVLGSLEVYSCIWFNSIISLGLHASCNFIDSHGLILHYSLQKLPSY